MGVFNFLPDKFFLKIRFRLELNKKLDLVTPKTFNEKLQWLKLYDRNPLYTQLVDKYEVRKYISNKIGDEYLIPLLGVWDNFDDINFDTLPNQFVLKCTHDSGGLVICTDKSKFDRNLAREKICKCLKRNFFNLTREWPYKNVKPRIIAEKYMVDESGNELKDYKFFCFDGVCEFLFVATERPYNTKFDFYDVNFNHLPIINGHPNSNKKISKPIGFEKMIELARTLSIGIPHVRVDFYNVNGKLYFGELTFFHYSGFTPFEPESWDYKFGNMINLVDER